LHARQKYLLGQFQLSERKKTRSLEIADWNYQVELMKMRLHRENRASGTPTDIGCIVCNIGDRIGRLLRTNSLRAFGSILRISTSDAPPLSTMSFALQQGIEMSSMLVSSRNTGVPTLRTKLAKAKRRKLLE
jgi:hypothetical protein